MPLRYQVGDQVVLVWTRALHPSNVGRYAEVIGVNGTVHCPGLQTYSLEFFFGGSGTVCECAFRRAPPASTPVRWRDCAWVPTMLKGKGY